MKEHLNITISGRVQGVGFRLFTERNAQNLGVKGFVKNLENGDVYIEAEIPPESYDKFVQKIKTGPKFSKVEKIKIEKGELKHFSNFKSIR